MSPWSETKRVIFVFGSNLAGRHGAGAALFARRHHGAIIGRPKGIQNNSYAIPTKDEHLKPLPLEAIRPYVLDFLDFARAYEVGEQDVVFRVTAIGTGYAGYRHEDIAPMFLPTPGNCYYPVHWEPIFRISGVELPQRRYLRR